jgi:TPP-dependent pyruvate/acetoin dehydrogenase alpha subunit
VHSRFYRSLYRIRRVEEEIARVYPTDKIKSPVHLSIGQEAVAVGVCEVLRPDDIIFCSYRSHASYLAKGGDLKAMIAELYGKITGCAKGKGGSMHLVDVAHGIMGASAVVGTPLANAAGYAYALKYRRSDALVACFFGDGAADEGVFFETLNWAALHQLPIIFICENNGYAIHTAQSLRQKNTQIWQKAAALGLPAQRIEGNDTILIYEQVSKAAKAIRSSQSGPFFFECMTYRWYEHVGPGDDYHLGFREQAELESWMEADQVARIGGMLDPHERMRIEEEVAAEINEAFTFAEQSPFPDIAELYMDVY